MTEIYLHFLFAHYGLYGNAPVLPSLYLTIEIYNFRLIARSLYLVWKTAPLRGVSVGLSNATEEGHGTTSGGRN